MIRFISVVTFVVLFLILSIPILILEWIIGFFAPSFKNKTCLKIVQWAFRCCLFLSGTKLTVIGKENIPVDTAVLYVANHRSFFDILINYVTVPTLTGFVAKKEMKKIPLLSTWMYFVNCLFLDRKNVRKGMETILAGVEKMKSGISMFIFPEGTRNKQDLPFLPFKAGSLKIAEKSGCPIVPVAINNSADIFENHFPKLVKTHVILEYGKPIPTAGISTEEKKTLAKRVEAEVLHMFEKNRSI